MDIIEYPLPYNQPNPYPILLLQPFFPKVFLFLFLIQPLVQPWPDLALFLMLIWHEVALFLPDPPLSPLKLLLIHKYLIAFLKILNIKFGLSGPFELVFKASILCSLSGFYGHGWLERTLFLLYSFCQFLLFIIDHIVLLEQVLEHRIFFVSVESSQIFVFGGQLSGFFLCVDFLFGLGVFAEMHALVALVAWRRVLGGKGPGADTVLLGFGLGLGAEDLFVGVDYLL